jgi:hypothetical protein
VNGRELTTKGLLQIAKELATITRATPWWWGDLLVAAEPLESTGWTADFEEWTEKIPHLKYKTLANYKSVAKAFPFSRRREKLDLGHHDAVNQKEIPEDVADMLLDEAARGGWKVRQLRERVEAWKLDNETKPEPDPEPDPDDDEDNPDDGESSNGEGDDPIITDPKPKPTPREEIVREADRLLKESVKVRRRGAKLEESMMVKISAGVFRQPSYEGCREAKVHGLFVLKALRDGFSETGLYAAPGTDDPDHRFKRFRQDADRLFATIEELFLGLDDSEPRPKETEADKAAWTAAGQAETAEPAETEPVA